MCTAHNDSSSRLPICEIVSYMGTGVLESKCLVFDSMPAALLMMMKPRSMPKQLLNNYGYSNNATSSTSNWYRNCDSQYT